MGKIYNFLFVTFTLRMLQTGTDRGLDFIYRFYGFRDLNTKMQLQDGIITTFKLSGKSYLSLSRNNTIESVVGFVGVKQ